MKKSLLILLAILTVATACNNKGAKVAESETSEAGQKLQGTIVEIYNNLYPKVESSVDTYSRIFDYEKGPQGDEKNVESNIWSLDLKPDYSTDQKIKEFNKAASDDELSKTGLSYTKSYLELSKIVEDMKTYYKRGDYKDDSFVKGKQLHTAFKRTLEEFYGHQDKLHSILEEIENKENKTEIEDAVENKYKAKEQFYRLTMLSKELLTMSKKSVDKIDKGQFKAKVEQFDKSLSEFSSVLTSNKEELKKDTYKGILYDMLEMYKKDCDEFYGKAKTMSRKLEDPIKETTDEQSIRENMLSEYNSMVNSYNNVMEYKDHFEF